MFFKKRTLLKLLLLIFSALFLVSCSSPQEKVEIESANDDAEFIEEAVSPEVSTRQPIFVYKNQSPKVSEEITLRLNAEPLLLPSGYVRLVGVVSGGRPIACLEIGGRGLCVEIGEEISGYRIVGISKNAIYLKRRES